jgi:hypothetical protein
MKAISRIGVVAAGYVAAILLASAAVAIRVANTDGPDAQASSGMYAFGDAVVFVSVFGIAGLLPTGAALFFLRPYRRLWTVLSGMALAAAFTGLAAVALFAAGRYSVAPAAISVWVDLSVLVILPSPLLALAFGVCAAFSPYRPQRIALLGAAVLEAAVAAYAAFVWFLPLFLHGK